VFPRIGIVGDWILELCREKRQAVTFPHAAARSFSYLERGDKVSRVSDDYSQRCHQVAGIPDRGLHGITLNDHVLFRLLSVLVGITARNDMTSPTGCRLVNISLSSTSLASVAIVVASRGALFRGVILVDDVDLYERGPLSFFVSRCRTSYTTMSAAQGKAPLALR
jgi:hypothetical protein